MSYKKRQKTLRIGLTGGIGTGKSAAADYFAGLGVPVIDADSIVHELLRPGTKEYKAIIKHFGNAAMDNTGQLRRRYLRKIIFTDSREKTWLEKLLHPKVYAILQKRAQKISAPYCILVIPLLIETKPPADLIDRILVVDAYKTTQIKRIMRRDNTSAKMAKDIIANQTDRKTRLKQADDIVHNNGSLENLFQQVKKLHAMYQKNKYSAAPG